MLIYFFAFKMHLFPILGYVDISRGGFSNALWYLTLPSFALGLHHVASLARYTRSTMLDVLNQDYIRTARAKGQKEWIIIWKHALKNALIPVITVVGLSFGKLLGGAVVSESVFSIAGIGKLMVEAIKTKNYPMVQGGILFLAAVMCFVNLAVDILYAFVDPRIRSQYVQGRKRRKGKEEQKDGQAEISD